MGEHFGRTSKHQLRANIISPKFTQRTLPTREANFQGYAIADLEISHIASDAGNRAAGFVAETEWFADDEIAVAAMPVVVEV